MRTSRTCMLGATLSFFAACGGSGTGDVTIATDDPPQGASATAHTGALPGDLSAQRNGSSAVKRGGAAGTSTGHETHTAPFTSR